MKPDLFLCILQSLVVQQVISQDTGNPTPIETVEIVIAGIENNYSQFKTFQFQLKKTTEDSQAEHNGEGHNKEVNLPNSVRLSVIAKPINVWNVTCLFKGKMQKYEIAGSDGKEQVVVIRDKDSLEYVPSLATAWRRPEGGNTRVPLDVREACMPSMSRTLAQLLRGSRNVETKSYIDQRGSKILQISMLEEKGYQKIVGEFLVDRNFLPQRIGFYDIKTASLLFVTDYEYVELARDKCWFPSQALRRTFKRGMTKEPLIKGWDQRLTWELIGDVKVNEERSDSEFYPEIPPNTKVRDAVDEKVYVVYDYGNGISWKLALLATSVVALAVLFFVKRYKRQNGGSKL